MKSTHYPLSRKDNIVVQEIPGEVMIYDLDKNKAFCLNETSAIVWQLCDGKKSISEISELVSKKLDSSVNEDLVWLALDQLKKELLVETEVETPVHFQGETRRQIIKKIGLTTMIALPIVASLAAPKSVMAASCGPTMIGAALAACLGGGSGFSQMCISCCCNGLGTCEALGALANGMICLTDCRCASGNCMGGTCMA